MLDSGAKHPENRIHLFDPVGLINDGYGGYRSSNYAVRPKRPTKSYGNFEEVSNNSNGGLRSYDSFTADTNDPVNLRPYNSFTDADSVGIRSYDSFTMETNGGGIRSNYDQSIEDRNSGGLRFGVDNVAEDEADVSTPRLWGPSSPTSPKAGGFPLHPTSPKSLDSTPLHHKSPKSVEFAPFPPTIPKPLNSSSLHHKNLKSVNSLPLHPTSSKSVDSSPLHPSSPNSMGSSLHHNHHHYHQNMSPTSRTQAIAKGRRELMDMVRDLPETFYELSLKDIVEQKAEMEVQKEVDLAEEKKIIRETTKPKETKKQKKSSKKVKKSESKKKMVRSKSVNDGRFLLRTSVFPIFSGSKKNKKNLGPSNSFKIAPMPKPQPTSSGSMKVAEKDWWRRKSCISSESDESHGLSSKGSSSGSSSSSSRSNSINTRRSNRFLPSCCLFNGRKIRSKK